MLRISNLSKLAKDDFMLLLVAAVFALLGTAICALAWGSLSGGG
jgi:hypothetical protein